MNARTIVHTLLVPAMLGAALLAQALPAAAQDATGAPHADCVGGHGDHPFDPARFAQHWQMRAQRLSQRLGLDARQQQALDAIVRAEVQRFQQTVGTLPEHTPQRHAARIALMADFDARLTAILSPVQRGQWQGIKEEMRARHEQRRGEHGSHGDFGGREGVF